MYAACKKESMYFKLFKLLLLAGVASILVFNVLLTAGDYLVSDYFTASDYEKKRSQKSADSLQRFVEKNNIHISDTKQIEDWLKEQAVVTMQMYKDNMLIYDSAYPAEMYGSEEGIEEDYYDWEYHYVITFADGKADVLLYGFYEYQLYNYALIVEIGLSFLVFLCVVMLGIRRTMKYIRKLSSEIEILEGGNLSYEITVSGKDELSNLARGLNDMRKSFLEQTENEVKMKEANQKMITEMSHDLRTPLTSLMLYTSFLSQHKYKDEQQLQEYVQLIERKTHQMKQLSDNIFEYALISGQKETELEEMEEFEVVFYDYLSELAGYLEQNGYQVMADISWKKRFVRINTGYLMRIMDNLISNIQKYADPGQKVKIGTVYTADTGGFFVENGIRVEKNSAESTHIGIENMKKMMKQMNGCCEVSQQEQVFRITFLFKRLTA